MPLQRFEENPLIRPEDVKPSRPGWQVLCAFNCGCVQVDGQIFLLLRVAERPTAEHPAVKADEFIAPIFDPDAADAKDGIRLLRVCGGDPDLQEVDSRMFRYRGQSYLTSLSHFRLAYSQDGRHFTVQELPAMFPATADEEYGIEDPRIVCLDGVYYINYTAVSRHGIATALASTRDFKSFDRHGLILAPDNRNVTIFPEKMAGHYLCFHRPMGSQFGQQSIWSAESPDLRHWGHHRLVCSPRLGQWDEYKVGGAAVPIRTERGWLSIYHGANFQQRYCLGLLLTDLQQPSRVIARSTMPILEPEADYETQGFFGNVVFSCGAIRFVDDRVVIYYGASDQYTCGAETTLDELLHSL